MPFKTYATFFKQDELVWNYVVDEPVPSCYLTTHNLVVTTQKGKRHPNYRYVAPLDINLGMFTQIQTLTIEDATINQLVLPESIINIYMRNSTIQSFALPPNIELLSMYQCEGIYNIIQHFPESLKILYITGDHIRNLYIPNNASVVTAYMCRVDKITNERHHIQREMSSDESMLVLVMEDNESPYTLFHVTEFDSVDFTYVENTYTTLQKLEIIYGTNRRIETIDNTTVAVRLRTNVFRQDTHVNTDELIEKHTPELSESSIYQVMRLGSNYPRRWLEFVVDI